MASQLSARLPVILCVGLLVSAGTGRLEAQTPQPLRVTLEHAHLWYTYPGTGGTRYFVTQIVIRNDSRVDQSVKLDDFVLTMDGQEFKPQHQLSGLQGFAFEVDGQTFRFSQLNPDRAWSVPMKGTAANWLIFTDLPRNTELPQLTLRWTINGEDGSRDITQHHMQRLGLNIERLGPDNMLGLLTVDGKLDSINASGLVKATEALADDGILRIVLALTDNAAAPSEDLQGWLVQTSERRETGGTYAQLPTFPSTFHEFHICMPRETSDTDQRDAEHFHASTADAVAAALRTACEVLPVAVLVEQLHRGHRLVRAAVLRASGPRLPAQQLPVVLDLVDTDDPLMRLAAVAALRHFPDPAAVERLRQLASGGETELSELALEALAASRFADAQRTLEPLASQLAIDSPETVIHLFSRYPSAFGADLIASVLERQSTSLPPVVHAKGLATLGHVGHERLFELCQLAMMAPDPDLQQSALGLLASRPEPRAEQLALDYTLKYIAREPPTPLMHPLLDRCRDPRAVPLLLRHLDNPELERSAIITMLVRSGGPEMPDLLAERFPVLKEPEQVAVLNGLMQLGSPRLRDLAPLALRSQNGSLVNAAVNGLQLDGSPAAVTILGDALRASPESASANSFGAALREIGTDEARAVLTDLRQSADAKVRRLAARSLQELQANSPAKKHVDLGMQLELREDWKAAIREYSRALELDDSLAQAYSGRAHGHLQLDSFPAAREDYERAVELDPDDDIAVTGLAIVYTRLGDVSRGIETVEGVAKLFDEENRFAYNRACVYGRAVENLLQQPPTPERDTQLQASRAAAISAIERAIELGFEDLEWLREDPDLKPLHDLDEFQQIANPTNTDSDDPSRQPDAPPRQE